MVMTNETRQEVDPRICRWSGCPAKPRRCLRLLPAFLGRRRQDPALVQDKRLPETPAAVNQRLDL